MLPPFVPPMARVSSESLPLITEFVVDRSQGSFEMPSPAAVAEAWTSEDVSTLPSIQDFLLERAEIEVLAPPEAARAEADAAAPEAATAEAAAPEASAPEAATAEASEPERQPEGEQGEGHPVEVSPSASYAPDAIMPVAMIPEPIVNEVMESADAWSDVAAAVQPGETAPFALPAAIEDSGGLSAEPRAELEAAKDEAVVSQRGIEKEKAKEKDKEKEQETETGFSGAVETSGVPQIQETSADSAVDESTPHPVAAASESVAAPAEWVAAERDAFDWQGLAGLAVPPDEERRAAEEWSSTEWDRTRSSADDHVAGLLSQVARRVRSGELQIQSSHNMSAEAALAAVLAALLIEPPEQ